MRHVLVPIREELGEGEAEWIIVAAETVINSCFLQTVQSNSRKEVDQ
jgi:hypothetical protein